MVVPSAAVYEFGEFRLDTGKQRLLRGDQMVALTPRAVETLRVLIEHRGELVERDALLAAVWRDVVVEDGNLTVTVSMIRKALGDDPNDRRFIETVPRLGYKFVADVRVVEAGRAEVPPVPEPGPVPDPVALPRPKAMAPNLAVAAVLIAGVAIAYALPWFSKAEAGAATIRSIAVMPLTPLSGVPEDAALGLGFADALMTSLAGEGDVRVRSTRGVNPEGDGVQAPADLGRALDVDAVLNGTLQRANGWLRATLRLIRTSDGSQVWTDSFDERETEIFKLQDTMASQTAKSLKWSLANDGRPRANRYTNNRDAYHAYLLGRMFFDKRQADDYEKAIAEFERAIVLDPSYALALTGLADVYALQANVRTGAERDALYEQSRSMAIRALKLDEALAEAHTSLGWVKRVRDWDWSGSEAEFKRALELNPSDVNAHQWYAMLLTTLGRTEEAIRQIEAARDLAPLSSIVLQNYFTIRQHRRETAPLVALSNQIARLSDAEGIATRFQVMAHGRAGDYGKVIEMGDLYRSQNPGQPIPGFLATELAIAYNKTHAESKAKEMLTHLEEQSRTDSHALYRLASLHAEFGRRDQAIALLEKCFSAHDDRMVWLKVEPRFDSLREDERFKALLRRMHL
jgi:DNA-binding winged helix-turn-helix (wHTH) protein/TolB-like protein/Tfp pilus assembly protein PilF